jgi:hypothetical protein
VKMIEERRVRTSVHISVLILVVGVSTSAFDLPADHNNKQGCRIDL